MHAHLSTPIISCITRYSLLVHFYAPDHCSLYFVFASLSLSLLNLEALHNQHISKARGTAHTMERLFSPCTRYRDLLESRGRLEAIRSRTEILKEMYLDVSTEELLSAERAFTYVDLHAMSGNQNRILWLTPHAFVARKSNGAVHYCTQLDGLCGFSFRADGKDILALTRSPERLLEICDVLLRLLAASVVHSLLLCSWSFLYGELLNTRTLAYLIEQCSSLKLLTLTAIEMDANHCRVLGAYSRPDLEIKLMRCKLTSAGSSALAGVLGRDQGPTELNYCHMDIGIGHENGLHGNSRLKSFTMCNSGNSDDVNRQVLAIAGTLKENKGLVVLDLSYCSLSDKTWVAVCDSLKTHPTLQVLKLRMFEAAPLALAVQKSRIQALTDMLKENMSIHTISLADGYTGGYELFPGAIIPYLETNRLRPRVHAIQKTRPIAYRAKILGRALLVVRTDANSLWMLLSGNPEVAFSSTTATTTPATSPPTPTAVATSNAATATAAVTFYSWCLYSC
jgi:hypothetical protein